MHLDALHLRVSFPFLHEEKSPLIIRLTTRRYTSPIPSCQRCRAYGTVWVAPTPPPPPGGFGRRWPYPAGVSGVNVYSSVRRYMLSVPIQCPPNPSPRIGPAPSIQIPGLLPAQIPIPALLFPHSPLRHLRVSVVRHRQCSVRLPSLGQTIVILSLASLS
jgi:hypothetical protein